MRIILIFVVFDLEIPDVPDFLTLLFGETCFASWNVKLLLFFRVTTMYF